VETASGQSRYADDYLLGIGCAKCHGEGREHVDYQTANPKDSARFIVNPARLDRQRQLDNCALCHSGPRRLKQPPFSYRPGLPLEDFLQPVPTDTAAPVPDVHGDQIGLLSRSRCFRESAAMTCSTCHDVHRTERDAAAYSAKCLGCHQPATHPMAAAIGDRLVPLCVDCHMPTKASRGIEINNAADRAVMEFRTHRIAVYPEVTANLLGAKPRVPPPPPATLPR
jgi:predicted CXXCH cytochrome family protein